MSFYFSYAHVNITVQNKNTFDAILQRLFNILLHCLWNTYLINLHIAHTCSLEVACSAMIS